MTLSSWDDLRFTISTLLTIGFSAHKGDDVDISALTVEQYLALIQDNNRLGNNRPGIGKPKIGDDVEFKKISNFMRELRRKLFAGIDDDDAHEHVRRGRALRWKKRLPAGMINTWDLLEKEFICPYRTRKTVCMIKNHGEVHNLKAREDEEDMDVGLDITVEDVERLRQFLTPTIHTLPNLEPIVQPYMSLGPVHDKEKIVRE
nr:hypothetical protein [Tanacetum cinerariifolium]